MDVLQALIAAATGYLCGSISFARLVGRAAAPEEDLTKTEIDVPGSDDKVLMGSVSATTVSMHLGPRLGFLTVVLDMLKIAIPMLVLKRVYPDSPYFLLSATTGMVGHIWPIYHRFKGGRGMSAVYGGMFVIDWIGVFATSLGGMLFGLVVLRDVLAAYMAGMWFLIPWLWFRTRDLNYVAYAIAVNVILVVAMLPEMKQVIKLKREGKGEDLSAAMQLTGMGRGIHKLGKRLGVIKD